MRVQALRARLDALAHSEFEFWATHGPDPKYGGFYGTLDRAGQPIAPSNKGLIQQARQLWTFSMWFEKKQQTPEVRRLAENQYHFLTDHFYEPQSHEFVFTVSESGAPVDPKKVLYAEAFAIYGLSEYARVFHLPDAARYALECFKSLDARAHDAQYGGYDQTHDPAWLSPGAQKEMNTHLHLLEAFAALYEATHDALVGQRVSELVDVTAQRIVQPAGYQRLEFLRDWSVFGQSEVSYGHDLETSWLLPEAANVVGRGREPAVLSAALAIGVHSADWGFDPRRGGFFEAGPAGGGPATKREKVWWIQCEALPALWQLYARTREPRYLDRFEATLAFLENVQRDARYGELYWSVLEDGTVSAHGDNKGEEWKAGYHVLRALVFSEEWLSIGLGKSSAP
jgi:mannobiose 2-epimerase